jgi:hypothetical protein
MDWIYMAQGGTQYLALVKKAINLHVKLKERNILSNWSKKISFSRGLCFMESVLFFATEYKITYLYWAKSILSYLFNSDK